MENTSSSKPLRISTRPHVIRTGWARIRSQYRNSRRNCRAEAAKLISEMLAEVKGPLPNWKAALRFQSVGILRQLAELEVFEGDLVSLRLKSDVAFHYA
jgi:hypothetical protein